MSIERLCVFGAGNVFLSPDVFAALAGYFGERPLEIRFHDCNLEFLDLNFDLALVLHQLNSSNHKLVYCLESLEATENADGILVMPQIPKSPSRTNQDPISWPKWSHHLPPDSNLIYVGGQSPNSAKSLENWPSTPPYEWQGLQILRWIRGEEYPYEVLKRNQDSPIRRWLANPSLLEL